MSYFTFVSELTLDKDTATILMSETLDLTVTYIPENATDPALVWESGDSTVVRVQGDGINAVVTPIGLGTATVTVRTGDGSNLFASCVVTVWLRGDVNADGQVNISDVSALIDYIYGNNPPVFIHKAADTNFDNQFNISDVSGIIDIIYGY